MPVRWLFGLLACSLLASQAHAQDSAEQAYTLLVSGLKPLLRDALPHVLYEKEENWGHQAPAVNGLKWRGLRPQVQKGMRNDGIWKKTIITTRNLPQTFELRAHDFRSIDDTRHVFKLTLGCQLGVLYDQQNWESGVRLYSGSIRARLNLKAELECDSNVRLELDKSGLPEFVFRMRVTRADVHYDHLVVEHIAGVGGTAAKLLGEVVHESLKKWRPSIERRLLDRANEAIVKAADTREVRLGLTGLTRKK